MKNELKLPSNFVALSTDEMESISSGPLKTEINTFSLYNVIRKTMKPINLTFFKGSK